MRAHKHYRPLPRQAPARFTELVQAHQCCVPLRHRASAEKQRQSRGLEAPRGVCGAAVT